MFHSFALKIKAMKHLFFLLIAALALASCSTQPKYTEEQQDKLYRYNAVKDTILKALNSPRPIEFPSDEEMIRHVEIIKDEYVGEKMFLIESYFDQVNEYGQPVRKKFKAGGYIKLDESVDVFLLEIDRKYY